MPLQLDLLDEGLGPESAVGGTPLKLSVESIEEDPNQPRCEFDDAALRELASTIAERGVRTPISVRPHESEPGRWRLNFGARRLRASRLAGKTEIPAFVDLTADSYDQVIENEQRQGLQPLELALFVQRQLKAGTSKADVARRLGKTPAYVTFVGALIDAPDWLLEVYRSGRCRGITELYELRKLHEARPSAVDAWLGTQEKVGRENLQSLKRAMQDSLTPVTTSKLASSSKAEPAGDESERPGSDVQSSDARRLRRPQSRRKSSAVLWALLDGAEVMIDLDAVPSEEGRIYVRRSTSGERLSAEASGLKLLRAVRLQTTD